MSQHKRRREVTPDNASDLGRQQLEDAAFLRSFDALMTHVKSEISRLQRLSDPSMDEQRRLEAVRRQRASLMSRKDEVSRREPQAGRAQPRRISSVVRGGLPGTKR